MTRDTVAPGARAFLEAAERAGYSVAWCNRQNHSLAFRGQRIGGWNNAPAAREWYVNATAAAGHEALLRGHGFRESRRASGFRPWTLKGAENAATFRAVVVALTGAAIA